MWIRINKVKVKSKKLKVKKYFFAFLCAPPDFLCVSSSFKLQSLLCDLCVKSLRPLRLMDLKDATFETYKLTI
jgi:hypothetical protein